MAGKRSLPGEERNRGKKTKKAKGSQVAVESQSKICAPRGFFCIAPSNRRFALLATFLKKNLKKKIVVIFSTFRSLLFHSEVFTALGIPNLTHHEKLDDAKASSTVEQFKDADKGLLLTTDAASRNMIIPPVDWILQFELPADVEKYKRLRQQQQHPQERNNGGLLLFLLPHEIEFLKENEHDSLLQCDFSGIKIANLQSEMEKLVQKNYRIHRLSIDAYSSYMESYASSFVFDVKRLDVQAASVSFGIKKPPKVLRWPDGTTPSNK